MKSHRVAVRKKFEFLQAAVRQFDSARIALEGDLSHCKFSDSFVISHQPDGVLLRNTTAPVQDFVILKLDLNTREEILQQIRQAGLKHGVRHVLIECRGELQLGAYDQLNEESVVTGPMIAPQLLHKWKDAGFLWRFEETEMVQ